MRGNERDDSLVGIISSRVVVYSVSGGRDGVSSEIAVDHRGVELFGRVNLCHVGAERSDLTVGSAEWCVVVTGNDKHGLGKGSSVHPGRGSDSVYDQLITCRHQKACSLA